MNNVLHQLLTPMNIGFGAFMLILFIYSFIKICKYPEENSTIPNLIAALGIIGTFAGIFIGLLDFDTAELDKSIPLLLDGMKTAFATSLVGLTFSNILKCFQSYRIKRVLKKRGRDQEEVSLERIASLMFEIKDAIVGSNSELVTAIRDIKESSSKTSEENRISMKNLVDSLTGNQESSLVSEMKRLRESMIKAQMEAQDRLNTGLEKMSEKLDSLVKTNNSISTEIERGNNLLIEEFRVFSKNMAENNMKAFTEAIQECIKDLNNQLQEQFGENFKHLNLAVEKLLDWQIHYKETIEKTNANQVELYNGMNKARELVIEINERSRSIVEVANKLGEKIITFDTQQKTLNSSIEVLNKISLEAKELIPNLDDYINEFKSKVIIATDEGIRTTQEIKNQVLESTKNIESYITDVDSKLLDHTLLATDKITNHVVMTTQKGIEEINKSSLNVLEKVNIVNQEAVKSISKISDYFENQSIRSIEHIDSIQNSMKSTTDVLLENISKVSVNISKNIEENNNEIVSVRSSIKELTQVSTDNIKKQQNEIIVALKDLTTTLGVASNLNIKAMEDQILSIEKAVVRFENEGFTLTKKISDNIQVMVENNNSNLQTSIYNINESLGVTLNNSLQSLGEQLAAVSEKFVSDYIPLTIELQKVVNLAKKVG